MQNQVTILCLEIWHGVGKVEIGEVGRKVELVELVELVGGDQSCRGGEAEGLGMGIINS